MTKEKFLIKLLQDDAKEVNSNLDLSFLEGKSITISGSTGLVGLNIICSLIDYNTNHAKKLIKINALCFNKPQELIYKHFKLNNINLISGDLNTPELYSSIPLSDYIVHSAGYGQPGKFLEDKIKTISINTSATIELSNRLKTEGSFLFLSSAEVYSGSKSTRNIESEIGTTSPNHPRACYIEGKRAGEAIINALREKGINAVSARLALAYGPGVRVGDERVINQLIEKGLKGEIQLLDSGSALRTYCYISDATSMLLNLLFKNKYSVYNVGGKSTISIKDLAIKIGDLMSVPVIIPKSDPYLSDAPKVVGLDLTCIEKEYGHKKYIDINDGLNKTIQWIRVNNEQ